TSRAGEQQQVERRDDARDAGLLAERGVPRDVAEQSDRRDREPADRERIAERDPEELVEVGRRLTAAQEVRVARHDPERGAIESCIEQGMPDREEATERAVLQVDVVPAIEEEPYNEQGRQQTGDEVLAPDRFRSHLVRLLSQVRRLYRREGTLA